MRKMLLMTAAVFGLGFSLPAFAQTMSNTPNASWPWAHQPGTGESGPASNAASNIDSADAHSDIAPHLPQPMQGQDGSPEAYLRDAQRALMRNQTGLAQQSLEMAETRLLDRSTLASQADVPDQSPEVRHVNAALSALAHRDTGMASQNIRMALANAPGGMANNGMAGQASYQRQYPGGMQNGGQGMQTNQYGAGMNGNPGMQNGGPGMQNSGMAQPNTYPAPAGMQGAGSGMR